MMVAMGKPTYAAVTANNSAKPAIIFVPSRKQARLTAVELVTQALADNKEDRFLHVNVKDLDSYLSAITDSTLLQTIPHGNTLPPPPSLLPLHHTKERLSDPTCTLSSMCSVGCQKTKIPPFLS